MLQKRELTANDFGQGTAVFTSPILMPRNMSHLIAFCVVW
jgi:hypothetical protein